MKNSPLSPNSLIQDEDTNNYSNISSSLKQFKPLIDKLSKTDHQQANRPDIIDVLLAKKAFTEAFNKAKAIIPELNRNLKRLANMKELNPFQVKDQNKTKLILDILIQLTNSSSTLVQYMAQNEAQAFQDIAESGRIELEMMAAQQKRLSQVMQEVEQLKQENAEQLEMIELLTSQFLEA